MAITERRKYRRVADAVGLHIYSGTADEPTLDGEQLAQQLNSCRAKFVRLSAAGMRLFDSQPIDAEKQIEMALMLQPENRTVKLTGEVVSTGEEIAASGDKRYYAGINFVDVSQQTRDLLVNHVNQVLRQIGSRSYKPY